MGALGQLSWTTLDYDQSDASIGLNANTDIEFLQLQVAVGPIFSPVDGFSIYGGPFFHVVYGEMHLDDTILGVPEKLSVDIEQKSIFGGYFGTQIDIGESVSLYVETQFSGEGFGVATGFAVKF